MTILGIAGVVTLLFLIRYYPVAVDWAATYHAAAEHWRDPYGATLFSNPPWALLLLPHAFIDLKIGNAMNLLIHIVVMLAVIRYLGGNWQTLAIVFTSPFFFDLIRTNNIDWIPLASVLLPPAWGLPLLLVKPQALGGMAVVWWKQQNYRLWMFVPAAVWFGLSLVFYGLWIFRAVGLPEGVVWDIAPFPFGLPLGIYILYQAYKHEDEALAATATPFLTPYLAPYSLATVMVITGCKYRKETFIVYVASWVFFIFEARRVSMGMVG